MKKKKSKQNNYFSLDHTGCCNSDPNLSVSHHLQFRDIFSPTVDTESFEWILRLAIIMPVSMQLTVYRIVFFSPSAHAIVQQDGAISVTSRTSTVLIWRKKIFLIFPVWQTSCAILWDPSIPQNTSFCLSFQWKDSSFLLFMAHKLYIGLYNRYKHTIQNTLPLSMLLQLLFLYNFWGLRCSSLSPDAFEGSSSWKSENTLVWSVLQS